MKASAIILMFLGAALASPRVGMQAMHEVEANGKTAAAAPASTGGMHMGAHGHHRNISSHAPHEHPHMHPAPHWKGKHSHWHESVCTISPMSPPPPPERSFLGRICWTRTRVSDLEFAAGRTRRPWWWRRPMSASSPCSSCSSSSRAPPWDGWPCRPRPPLHQPWQL